MMVYKIVNLENRKIRLRSTSNRKMEQTFIRLRGGATKIAFKLYFCEVVCLAFIIFWPSEGILNLATIRRFRDAYTGDRGHLTSCFISVPGMALCFTPMIVFNYIPFRNSLLSYSFIVSTL